MELKTQMALKADWIQLKRLVNWNISVKIFRLIEKKQSRKEKEHKVYMRQEKRS